MNKLKINLKSREGITLISLVVTIIILIILASISISMILGNNGLLHKAQTASDETKKSQATETMNLKITNIQISSYAETQQLPNLQYLADKLCEDNDMEYVLTASKEHASLDKIDVTNISSIFTKLKEYPYEFEINSSLQLASIDGVKIADNNDDGTVTLTQSQYNSILNRLSALENNSNNTNTNENYSTEEQVIGTWIDGKNLYRKCYNGTTGSANTETVIVSADPIRETKNVYGLLFSDDNAKIPLNFYYSESIYSSLWENPKGNIMLKVGYHTNMPCLVIVEYTKTTDNATNN